MIELQLLGPDMPADWDELVESCAGNPLHCPAVHRIGEAPEGWRFLRFVERGEAVACALAFEQRPAGVRRLIGGKSMLRLATAPALRDPRHAEAVGRALLQGARKAGYARLRIEASCSQPLAEVGRPTRYGSIIEFTLDLDRDLEALRANYHKTHRKNVRRAQRESLRVVEDGSLNGLLALRALQLASSQRAEERAEGFGVPEPATFERLHEFVYGPGIGRLLLAYEGEEVVAALAWLQRYRRVLTVRSGSLPRGYELRAMYLLYDELIQRALADGVVELNAGGVPLEAAERSHPQAGLHEFKQGFGTTARERHGLEFDLGTSDAQ